mmetsp:Transcript_26536/g.29758  ORF Transcript_26536/g.29758 Transcript_26536/m.29758 type:complete len:162 (-) Transcript_26536:259-744(-)
MKFSSTFLSSVAVLLITLSNNTVDVVGQDKPGDATVYCDGGRTEGDVCTQTGAVCIDSTSSAGAEKKIECNGTEFVPFTGTVGEAFTDPPKPAKCDGTPEDCSGEVRINASKETAEADDMSNVVSGGDMTDVDGSGGYSATNTYVSTVAATAAAVCVLALL